MRTGLAARLTGWFGACLLLLTLAATAQGAPANPGTSPPTTSSPKTLPTLTPAENAQLMMEATTVVETILGVLQITLPAAEQTFVVNFVYHLFQMLTILQKLGHPTTGSP